MDTQFVKALDGTQPSNIPDDVWFAAGVTPEQLMKIKALPATQVSSMIPIVMELGKHKAKEVAQKLPVEFEINEHGERRCIYLLSNGKRCDCYGDKDSPICKRHRNKLAMTGNAFSSATLRDTYNRHISNTRKMSCDSELALMRTMLESLISKITDDNLNMEVVGAVTSMCDKITVVVDRMSKIEKITPETLNNVIAKITEIASTYIPAEKLEDFATAVENISIDDSPIPVEAIAIRTEPLPTVDDRALTVKKALLDTAQRMGVTHDS